MVGDPLLLCPCLCHARSARVIATGQILLSAPNLPLLILVTLPWEASAWNLAGLPSDLSMGSVLKLPQVQLSFQDVWEEGVRAALVCHATASHEGEG
jgi:hypothetical protein